MDRQAHDHPLDGVLADQGRQRDEVPLGALALEHRERIGDGGFGVGQGKSEAAAAEVDPEYAHGVENSCALTAG